jgi:ATP-dependent helicase/nuclease subunit A
VLEETAYAFELRGRRLNQARANLKKMRALVRRIENRGYPTLTRLADDLDTLRATDESNAVIEESGCVNLMTIHAAKGLEFPIVFVVNLHVPGRGRSSAFSLIERGPTGQPEVAFGSTAATKLEDLREREELRRLLYVSVTRARDRLVLAGEVDGDTRRLRRGARSLASLLPPSLTNLFSQAATSTADEVEWTSDHGRFAFQICRAGTVGARLPAPSGGIEGVPDVAPLVDGERRVVTTTSESDAGPGREETDEPSPAGTSSGRLIGTVVHRLFQGGTDPRLSESDIARLVPRLLRPEEIVDVDELGELCARAAGLYSRVRGRADVVKLLASGRCQYEVPFSFCPLDRPDELIRGRIDCLVERSDGSLTVLEFKTGVRRPEHDEQVALYVAALRVLAPDREVTSQVVYP